jgi:hypothetical protein
MNNETQNQLTAFAMKRTSLFCYGCYKEALSGKCAHCGSDDLMRLFPGVGCEYGTDWVIEHILKEQLEPVNLSDAFEDSVRQCYPETVTVGWMTLDTVDTMKAVDPVSWSCAQSEREACEADEGIIISFDHGLTYYYTQDVEGLLGSET